ncbi:L-rhamnose/proton symporter RhaT [Silvibacterium dinghuense]|uniref:L-rhamnose-proton symporter n=1 Tax=Silvibacterium dinghuense TaxID=1560006 RepID=A0A4Q1SCD0_9BACT|nr:L-rhamnose/proton symporter RhaT [Silvibacterium dinghuense]RXS94886.1 hypothetical protein ESZ00_09590 [Silvibacterium dinghuense]GGH08732.1 hypothetical protein GCM10011586_26410 [Silvibacterium dinghuense]
MHDAATGGMLLILAGVMNGSFALPMKRMPRWEWENVWLVWSLLALVVMPLATALACVPHLFSGLQEIPMTTLLPVVLCGAAWGVAQVLFGLSVVAIGMALTFSLVLGISAALGAVIPFLHFHEDLLWTRSGAFLFIGLGVLALGMALCAWAGALRERAAGGAAKAASIRFGLLLAIASGVCASSMNVGFSYAKELSVMAVRHGASPAGSATAEWLPLLAGGAIPNLFYAAYLLRRGTAGRYLDVRTRWYWLLTMCMASLWFAGTTLYGVASGMLGSLGAVLGWPVFMSIMVLVASLLGWMAGEWRGSGSRPVRVQFAGLILLTAAVFLFSRAAV